MSIFVICGIMNNDESLIYTNSFGLNKNFTTTLKFI